MCRKVLRPLIVLLVMAGRRGRHRCRRRRYNQQDSRSIAIHNLSGQDVESARVQTTDGKVWNLSRGSIPPNQARELIVPARDCIANVAVRLKNGQTLAGRGLHECRNTEIVVHADSVSIPRRAVPGGSSTGRPAEA